MVATRNQESRERFDESLSGRNNAHNLADSWVAGGGDRTKNIKGKKKEKKAGVQRMLHLSDGPRDPRRENPDQRGLSRRRTDHHAQHRRPRREDDSGTVLITRGTPRSS